MMRACQRFLLVIGTLGLVVSCATNGGAQSEGGRRDRDRGERTAPAEPDRQLEGRSAQPQLRPPRPPRPGQWYLGVRVRYGDTGAVVTDVISRSPASRVGLEQRDLIVAVDGFQIGIVNGRLYRLERELDLRANRFGRVRLLVQNHRNGRLTNVDVQLERGGRPPGPEPGRPQLTGTVTSRAITQLPRAAVLTIELVDVTDRFSGQYPIARKVDRDLGPLPIPFDLPYDPDRIDPDRQYALRAFVTVYGVMSHKTRETYRVFTNQKPGRVRLVLERAR